MQRIVSNRALLALATAAFATPALADIVVNDTWRDGTRDDPAAPTYSEMGVDGDADGDVESAWYRGGAGTLSAVNANPGSGPGVLRAEIISGSSSSITTYFTAEGTPVNLANPGDQLKVTWKFTPTSVNVGDTSQSFRMAIVDSPAASRISGEVTPGNDTYAGYSIFGNMATTLGNTNPFQLRERTAPGTASALLSAAGSWTSLNDQEDAGVTGYADGVEYTFTFTATRTALGELDVLATMVGGNLGGDGQLTAAFLDATPNSFVFDTFHFRPSSGLSSAAVFDTSLFKVEVIVPEPASLSVLAAGALALRRRRTA